ncbi:hypothetical protein FE257_011427 [Aspergillus nanangensis]|uniref:Peroxisomal hydratase-dehydrogenase-epimerase n=1 Tax=Aspergillus nanangensis TaxID=2582783 RepID=A0AAD4CHD7_ASPNN|nr:hypothetical protein FE257_011427 [Aspergillus nanangensis]
MSELRFDNQVAVITGAGAGLGREYALLLASRGASIVVNDLGGSFNGQDRGNSTKVADIVVNEIRSKGGKAVANYDSVENGERIIQTAIDAFGRIDILINNAGILRDISFKNIKDADWDVIMAVHMRGAYKCSRAAWPFFKKQRYGRIIQTSSGAGLFGNFGQTNYAAAKMGLIGLMETLAFEGAKYNILSNAIVPTAGSRLTATVMTPEMMQGLSPHLVAPIVTYLVHSSNLNETGGIFEAGAGHFSKIRWERAAGAIFRPDDSFTPSAVLQKWDQIHDFAQGAEHPTAVANSMAHLRHAMTLPPNMQGKEEIEFKGRVVLVTGAGNGLGRAYSRLFARLGAKVAVNDVEDPEGLVKEIRATGGDAVGIKCSVEEGDKIVQAVVQAFGRIDIIVNNAGILRDKAFVNMTDDQWDSIQRVHLRGTYKVTKAAWPYMVKARYGRIVNVTSTSGIYGNFGQANYAAAKCAVIGFTYSLAREGAKYNILVNAVAPSAGTRMTLTVRPEEEVLLMKPDYVAPLVAALCSDKAPTSPGKLYEAGCGWIANTRWQRTRGCDFADAPSLEDVAGSIAKIVDFNAPGTDNPETPADGPKFQNITRELKGPNYTHRIGAAMRLQGPGAEFKYTQRDGVLYNLGLGAKRSDLSLVYEGHPEFQILPTFGVVPTYFASAPFDMKDIIPNFDYRMLLHGEQFLEIYEYPIPRNATLITKTRLLEVVDKGKAAVVRRGMTTTDAATGKPLFYNESTAFVRGSGGFGGKKQPEDRGAATAANTPPQRAPDRVVEEKTSEELAAIYRLSGDENPLHIDPESSAVGGFKVPILHGLATFGISGKHLVQQYGLFRNIKVRFVGTVLPGQTLVTEMWEMGNNKIVYQVRVKDTGKLAIASAAVELVGKRGNPSL